MTKRPDNLRALQDGQLAPCPDSPNCVSSQATDPQHAVKAIAYHGSVNDALSALRRALDRDPRATVVADDRFHLSVEYRTRLLGFVDDVDLYVSESERMIHIRSASRRGYSDFGTNRRRVERIRAAFEAEQEALRKGT